MTMSKSHTISTFKAEKAMSLDVLLELAEKQAHHMLLVERVKQLVPVFVLVSPRDELSIISCPWENDTEKQIMLAALREAAKGMHAVMLSNLSEAWVSPSYGPGVDLTKTTRPSLHPERREVVIALATDGTNTKSRIFEIKRDWKGKISQLIPETTSDDMAFAGQLIDNILPIGGNA